MSKRVMKWKTCIVKDHRKELVYTFEDENGISLNAWTRYLEKRFGSASGWLMAEGKYPYETIYKDCTQIGGLR